jgi:hypothetical protein
MRVTSVALFAAGVLSAAACSQSPKSPAAPDVQPGTTVAVAAAVPLGESPPFNLEAILRPAGDGSGFGHVKFRQPKDNLEWIYLDVWVRDLAPNTTYLLQRAVDTELDGACTGSGWLTLGKDNVTPGPIVTGANGTGTAALSRNVGAVAQPGDGFDIHFRVIQESNSAVALESDCYRFVVRL